jgi:hypothetical protein
MNARRTFAVALGALLLGTAACGTHSTDAAPSAQQVAISTAISAQRGCSSDCGLANEPTNTRVAASVETPTTTAAPTTTVACTDTAPWPSDAVSVELAQRCDYRVTGQACVEDALCAVQQIRDTHDYRPLSATELGFVHDLLRTYLDASQACILGVAELEITSVRAGDLSWQGASDDAGDALEHPVPTCE